MPPALSIARANMIKIVVVRTFLAAILLAACSASPPPPAAEIAAPALSECKVDADCACGVDAETKQCAFGPAKRIDTSRQCPDFCTGIAGKMKIACLEGTCRRVKR